MRHKAKRLAGSAAISLAAGAIWVAAGVGNSDEADAARRRVSRYVKGEMLIKVSSRANLERFLAEDGAQMGALSTRKALLTDDLGSWYKVKIDSEAVPLSESLSLALQSEGVMASEPNFIYSLLDDPEVSPHDSSDLNGEASLAALPRAPRPTPTPVVDPEYKPAPALPSPAVADPRVKTMYGLSKVNAQAAWGITLGSPKIIVADIDTGIDYNHEDVMNNLWHNAAEIPGDGIDNDKNGYIDDIVGWDFKNKDARPYDDNRHGTHTFGTIAGTGGNGLGVSGVAQRSSVMVLRFLGGAGGEGTLEDAVLSIDYATKNGARIMSNSWGGDEYSKALFDAISRANAKNVVFLAAAGNSSENIDKVPMYPAAYQLPNVISVAATDDKDALAEFSSFGVKSVHVAAPGANILSTIPGNKYGYLSGTSMATPHVSGAVALLLSAYPSMRPAHIKDLLINSVDVLPTLKGKVTSGGRINLAKAFALAKTRFGMPLPSEAPTGLRLEEAAGFENSGN